MPETEHLESERGIIGLSSVAAQTEKALRVLNKKEPDKLFTVGGTCAMEIAPISYLNKLYGGKMGVLWFDAHGDLNTPKSSPSGRMHGMVLRSLLGEGDHQIVDQISLKLCADQVVLVGVRDLDPAEKQYISENRITHFPPEKLESADELIATLVSKAFEKLYIHLDLDFLSPTDFPEVLIPTRGGNTVEDLTGILNSLAAKFDIIGLSVVEFCSHERGGENRLAKMIKISTVADDLG